MLKLFFDPGHGGRDSGAVAHNLLEKDVNLEIASIVGSKILEEFEVQILYSRTTDIRVTLRERARMANAAEADLFVSFHSNGFTNSSPNGYEDFILIQPNPRSIEIREILHEFFASVWEKHKRANRGKKRADFSVLRNVTMPAVLIENGFITNDVDAKLLQDNAFLDELCSAHAEGLAKAMNLKRRVISPTTFYAGGISISVK